MTVATWLERLAGTGAVPADLSIHGASTALIWSWRHPEASEPVKAIVAAMDRQMRSAHGDGWNAAYQSQRAACDHCLTRYERGNLEICFGCFGEFCSSCMDKHGCHEAIRY